MAESDLFQGDLLARVGNAFRGLPGYAGLVLIGSGAAGQADYFSDLDILCLWAEALDRPRRYLALRALGETEHSAPQLLRFDKLELDRLRLGNREVEIMQLALPPLERLIEQVLDRQEIERYAPDRYGLWSPLAWLQRGVAFDDPVGAVATLQARVREWPPTLAPRTIAQQFAAIKLAALYHLYKASMRGDALFLHTILEDIAGHLLQAVFAFNHQFYPGPRGMESAIAALPLKPAKLYERLMAIYQTAPQYARDLPPAVHGIIRDVALLVAPWYPDAVPDWALGRREPAVVTR